MPKKNEVWAVIKPAAGVTPARPEMAPLMTAVVEGFPALFHERNNHTIADVTEPMWVTSKVLAAKPPDANALPALNPNHPIHSKLAPKTASGMLWGTMISGPKFLLRPKIKAAATDASPALVWITMPPAKSKTPRSASHPRPHTQCARG